MSMTIAQERCANYCNGKCLGIMITDNLTMFRFRKEGEDCQYKSDKAANCKYMGEIVRPGMPKDQK